MIDFSLVGIFNHYRGFYALCHCFYIVIIHSFQHLLLALHIVILVGHQIRVKFSENRDQLDVIEYIYAKQGIALLVHSDSEIIKVARQQKALIKPYKEVAFKSIQTNKDNKLIVLAEYDFSPDKEWYLELLNKNAVWVSLSPFFRKTIHISPQQWTSLWNSNSDQRLQITSLFPEKSAD